MHRLNTSQLEPDEEHPLAPAFDRYDAERAAREAGPTHTDYAVTVHSLPLPGGRRLHLALTRDASGAPAELVIAAGYAERDALYMLGSGVNLPASALPDLRDALSAIELDR